MYTSFSKILTVKVIDTQNNTYGLEFLYDDFDKPLIFINVSSSENHIRKLCDYLCKNNVSEEHIQEILLEYKSNPDEFISFISQ